MTRRQWMELAALAGPAAFQLRAAKGPLPDFSGWLARAALVDDAARLAIADGRVPKHRRAALASFPDMARAAVGLKHGSEAPSEPKALAAWLGARIAAHAAPGWGAQEDAAVLKVRGPQGAASKKDFEVYLSAIDYRCRIAFHTLAPEETDIHAWLEGIIRWSQAMADYKDRLAAALASPAGAAFASASDPLVRAALAVRSGRIVSAAALTSAKPETPYGKALESALSSLRA